MSQITMRRDDLLSILPTGDAVDEEIQSVVHQQNEVHGVVDYRHF